MRAVPTIPAIIIKAEIHPKALKPIMNENATTPPSTPPIAAMCVEIFIFMFIIAHIICMSKAAMPIDAMKWGT